MKDKESRDRIFKLEDQVAYLMRNIKVSLVDNVSIEPKCPVCRRYVSVSQTNIDSYETVRCIGCNTYLRTDPFKTKRPEAARPPKSNPRIKK